MPSANAERKPENVFACPALAVAVAFALRMILLWLSHHGEDFAHPRFETVGLEGQLVASSLAEGRGFFGPYPNYQAITACLAPVYPFLLAIGDKLFHLQSFGSTVFGQIMNSVFSAATCWPIYGIGKRVFGRRVGLASAWLWAVFPYAVLMPLEWVWDQSLSALLLAVIVWATLRLDESRSSAPLKRSSQTAESFTGLGLTGYGLLWAFAALTNPTLCVLLPFLVGWWTIRRRAVGQPSLAPAAKVMAIFVLAMLPWTIRNYYAVDGFVFVKSNFGMEFWLGNNPAVKEIYSPQLHPAVNMEQLLSLIFNGEPNYNRAKEKQAMAFIEAHPRVFVHSVVDRFADTWAATYDSRVEPWIVTLHLSRVNVWLCLGLSLLSLAGMIAALRSNWQEALPLAMCLLLFPIPYYITHTALRYRHPIDPFIAIFAAYCMARLWSVCTKSRIRSTDSISRAAAATARAEHAYTMSEHSSRCLP